VLRQFCTPEAAAGIEDGGVKKHDSTVARWGRWTSAGGGRRLRIKAGTLAARDDRVEGKLRVRAVRERAVLRRREKSTTSAMGAQRFTK